MTPRRTKLRLVSPRDFANRIIWDVVYKTRATLVTFNGLFDLSRLALGWRPAKGPGFEGGISLRYWPLHVGRSEEPRPHQYRPEIRVRVLDSRRSLTQFTAPRWIDPENRTPDGYAFPGHFVDDRTAAYAYSDRGHSLESASRAFGVPRPKQAYVGEHGVLTREYVDYNRADVEATYQLYRKLEGEHARHPIDLPLTQALSPAAIAKSYLRAMGVRPVLAKAPDFPIARLGHAATAYYGGRAECHIRLAEVPVTYCDLASMYPTVVALARLWRVATARTVIVAGATQRAKALLDELDAEALLDPATWPKLGMIFCRIRPTGQLLPVRAKYAPSGWQIGLNYLDETPADLWYALADLLTNKLLGGPEAEVLEAFAVVPRDVQPELTPVKFRGTLEIDPRQDDFFVRLVEERNRVRRDTSLDPAEGEALTQALKTMANSAAYGIWAEMRDEPLSADGTLVDVAGLTQFRCHVPRAERIGEFCFPPLAATITGLARLLLALFQCEVERRGGTYLACDTDSLVVLASEHGGPVEVGEGRLGRALSWDELDEVRDCLNRLNPYDRTAVPDLVKLEDQNFALRDDGGVDRTRRVELRGIAISAKRFVLYEEPSGGGVRIRKRSEHGLGALLSPTDPDADGRDWIDEVWLRVIARVRGEPEAPMPDWYALPALSRVWATNAHLLKVFDAYNAGRAYADQVKPGNFLLMAHDDPLVALPGGLERSRLTLIAPFSSKPGDWLHLEYRNRFDGEAVAVTTRGEGQAGAVRIKTYGDVIALYLRHPEAKSADTTGEPCHRGTTGLLDRLHVGAIWVRHIGKESNRLEEVEAGQLRITDDPVREYADQRGEWDALLPRLRELRAEHGTKYLMEVSGLSERAVRDALNRGRVPHRKAREALIALARESR
jgi:hypothetical protein